MAAAPQATISPDARRRAQGQNAQFRADVGEHRALLAEMMAVFPDVIARAAIGGFTGYGPGRGPGDVGRAGGISDPTAAAALALEELRLHPDRVDPIAHHVARALDELAGSLQGLRRAVNEVHAAMRVPARERDPDDRGPGCVNCHRYDIWSPVAKAGRCEACYRYWHRNDRDAPERLVTERPEISGRRERVRVDPTQPGATTTGEGGIERV